MHTVTRIALPMIGALLLFAANTASAEDPDAGASWAYPDSGGGGGGGGGSTNDLGYQLGKAFFGLFQPPRNTGPSPAVVQAHALNDRANDAFGHGDYATAESLYRQALEYQPADQVIRNNLAGALMQEGHAASQSGDYAAAARFYREALGYGDAQFAREQYVEDNLRLAEQSANNPPLDKLLDFADTPPANGVPPASGDSGNTGSPAQRTGSLASGLFGSALHQAGPLVAPTSTDSAMPVQTAAAEPPAPRSTAPDFHDADHDAPADKPSGTASGSGAAGANTDGEASNMFGEKNSGGGGLAQGSSMATPPAHSFGEEASSVAASGKKAQTLANAAAKNENPLQLQIAKADSNCGFDTANCAVGTSVSSPEDHVIGQTPGAAALASRIPDVAKGDKDIQLTLQWYQTLDGQKIDVQQRLAKVQADINNKNGDAADLAKEKSILSAQVTQLQKDETSAQGQIETRLQSHFHIPLLAAASESADGGKAKGPAEAKATDNNK